MGRQILYISPSSESLAWLQAQVAVPDAAFRAATPEQLGELGSTLRQVDLLVLGADVKAPIQLTQEAYNQDKQLSILLLCEVSNYVRVKQALRFSPFIGPTVQCVSVAVSTRLAPIVVDALQRTAQRRSFARLKASALATPQFEPQLVAKVRADFSTKVLEEAPIGAVLLSASGTIASINQYAIGLFGLPEQQVLNVLFWNLFPAALREEVHHFVLDGYLSTPKQLFAGEWGAETRYLELAVAGIDTQLAASYKILILNDITPAIVAQRQTQADLLELGRLNVDLDNFIYTASHDLKVPITNIEGLLLALRQYLPAEALQVELVPQLLDLMQNAVERFQQTIHQLTDIARLQHAHHQPAEAVGVAAVVEAVRLDLAPLLAEAGGHLAVEVPAAATVLFAPANLRSLVYNLLSNAFKYRHPERPPLVVLRTRPAAGALVLEVQDNGLGLSEAQQRQLFGMFKRLHDHVEGSGIGLYMVKRMVENAGGHIEVRSELGLGTTFTVSLPA